MRSSSSEHRHDLLLSLPKVQLERLSYIDFRLYFLGDLRRIDLTDKFGTGSAGASRDIALYRQVAPENLQFDATGKYYVTPPAFTPVFDHAPQRVLTALSQGFGEGGLGHSLEPLIRCEIPATLNSPRMEILAPITRAIHRKLPVRLVYHSMTSGRGEREIVPQGLIDNGVRWHVRAFDRKSGEFRDFVFSRMEQPVILDGPIAKHEAAGNDTEWNRVVNLEFVPHPRHKRPEVIKREYGMIDGVLRVRVRATNAGYMLRLWNIDCSSDHRLDGPEYMLWLRDSLQLYGVHSAVLAPGYTPPQQGAALAAEA